MIEPQNGYNVFVTEYKHIVLVMETEVVDEQLFILKIRYHSKKLLQLRATAYFCMIDWTERNTIVPRSMQEKNNGKVTATRDFEVLKDGGENLAVRIKFG